MEVPGLEAEKDHRSLCGDTINAGETARSCPPRLSSSCRKPFFRQSDFLQKKALQIIPLLLLKARIHHFAFGVFTAEGLVYGEGEVGVDLVDSLGEDRDADAEGGAGEPSPVF